MSPASALALLFVNTLSAREARRSVVAEAAVMMGELDATIDYTNSDVAPLLARQTKVQFLPQAIPFFTAQQTFNLLARQFPDYTLRQPTLNPTNPSDRPTRVGEGAWSSDSATIPIWIC